MDPSLYKDFTTSRGYDYHFFLSLPKDDHPYLLFLHGFPCTSFDWRHQVPFFINEGYGLIVPDLLGYGGSSKPTDPADFRSTLLTKDLVELVDAENAARVVAIGHDWGSKLVGRLANYYPNRFIGFGFLAVGYWLPSTENNYENFMVLSKNTFEYEIFGYWSFFSSEEAPKIIEENMESFLRLIHSGDPKAASDFAPTGALKSYLLRGGRSYGPLAPYITEEEKDIRKKQLVEGGMASCLNWYTIMTSGIDAEDNKAVPAENLQITKPVFYGGALKDSVAINAINMKETVDNCKNTTVHEYASGHWVVWDKKDELNSDLLSWVKTL
ncbi:alpha/beta-hydrolase [Guyanagaster necrorhizus]|uniref:Alpha/beta-hydrolase n=1 Tax=Guyanagaster necrorhizus TaxID=856835 RepID=A0A9P8AWJ9_9AGAR|nr:alpha/beta-hydrolase [Guyanagaster necrorhizus MCA 3950]KAG7450648.1 alpha/beta-hydrolase [Guyanagaster necrorhizus MCA 3950]